MSIRVRKDQFIVGKTYEFTDPNYPNWAGFKVKILPDLQFLVVAPARGDNVSKHYKRVGATIDNGFSNSPYWTLCGPQNSFGKWFKEHS